MPDYQRNRVPGGTYFFTVNLQVRTSRLLITEIDHLRRAVQWARSRAPFHIDAWVVLPNHMHCIWTLPEDDADFSRRWNEIKMGFSKAIPKTEDRSAVNKRRGERGIWQRRFWEHTIRDASDYVAHVDYTHFNPVKHGLVENAWEWPFSSFRRCVAGGMYPPDWAGPEAESQEFGERRQ
jgi:putative transposase